MAYSARRRITTAVLVAALSALVGCSDDPGRPTTTTGQTDVSGEVEDAEDAALAAEGAGLAEEGAGLTDRGEVLEGQRTDLSLQEAGVDQAQGAVEGAQAQLDVELSALAIRAADFENRSAEALARRPKPPAPGVVVGGATDSAAQSPEAAAVEDQFIGLANAQRAASGVPGLAVDGALTSYARSHAQAMAASGGIWHSNIASLLVSVWAVGENVGVGPNAPAIQAAYVDSPPHLQNMIDSTWTATGVGVYLAAGRVWAVQVFAG